MQVIAADGTRLHPLSSDVDVRGTASWSPDGKWIVTAGSDRDGAGLSRTTRRRRRASSYRNRTVLGSGVVSPRRPDRVRRHPGVFTQMPLLAVHPDGTPAQLPEINVQRDGERARFLPDGSGMVYMLESTTAGQDFWLLDLSTMRSRRLTRLSNPASMRTSISLPMAAGLYSTACGKTRTYCSLTLRRGSSTVAG